MTFTGFGKGAVGFYEELAADNSRDWWLAHKARYEDEVRRPMEELLEDVAGEFGEAKLFRPNRDTRFSRDKSPYKTNIAAVIVLPDGGSVYLSLSAEGLHVGGGGYHLDRDQLARYRAAVDAERSGAALERIAAGLRAAKADVTSHTSVKTAPAATPPTTRASACSGRTASSGSGPTARPPGSTSQPPRIGVVAGWRALQPLNDWLAQHVGPSRAER